MSALPERGTIVGNRYRLESPLGEGGMAVVWRAVHTETDRTVALKIIRRELVKDDQVREMFVREARVGARIGRNLHIVDFLDAGVDAALEVPFLAMELLDGEALDARIKRDGPVPRALVAEVIEQLADALDQAHAAGVIHRDLKPQNLFLALDNKQRTMVKVLDFGIAKLAESAQTSSTHVGTPAYSAPEQLGPSWRAIAEQRGRTIASQVSAGTDVWAMGLVMYEMLTGAASGALWNASTLAELPLKIVLEPTPSAAARAGERAALLPAGFDAWIARCLDLDASQRFPSAGAASAAILPMLRGSTRATATAPLQIPQAPPHATMPALVPSPAHLAAGHRHMQPDPLTAWANHRGAQLRQPADGRMYQAWNPLQFLPNILSATRELRIQWNDAQLLIGEVYVDDAVRRAAAEDRMLVALVSSRRVYYRAAIRSKASTGLGDGVEQGLKALDNLFGGSPPASLGDPHFERFFDLKFPSPAEGNAALSMPLRHLLMQAGFRGVLELRQGGFFLQRADVTRFEPADLDRLLEAATRIHAAIAP